MEGEQIKTTSPDWGGARTGAGRKRIAGRDCPVAYRISEKAKENIKRYAEERGLSLSAAVVQIFEGLY